MKFSKNVDLGVTIVHIIVAVMFIALAILCNGGADVLAGATNDLMEGDIDQNSVIAGYEALIKGFGALGGILGSIIALVAGIMFGCFAVFMIIVIVVAFLRRSKYNKTGDSIFIRRNLTEKIVLNSLVLVMLIGLIVEGITVGAVIMTLLIIGLELLLIQARKIANSFCVPQE